MKWLTLVFLCVMSPCFAVDTRLENNGWHEVVSVPNFGRDNVIVRANVGKLAGGTECAAWRWGSENDCPKSAIINLTVYVGHDQIFVPRSAFADLGNPAKINVRTNNQLLDVVIGGGDAGTAYEATLTFSKTDLKYRKVFGKEFKDTAWEETTYSFPK